MCWWSTTIRGTARWTCWRSAPRPSHASAWWCGRASSASVRRTSSAGCTPAAWVTRASPRSMPTCRTIRRTCSGCSTRWMRGPMLRSGSRFVAGAKHDYSGLAAHGQPGRQHAGVVAAAAADRRAHHVVARRQAGSRSGWAGRDDRKRRLWVLRHLCGAAGAGRALLHRNTDPFPRSRRWRVEDFQTPDRVRCAQSVPSERRSPPIRAARLAVRIAGLPGLRPTVPDARAVWRVALPGVLRLAGPDYSVSAAYGRGSGSAGRLW